MRIILYGFGTVGQALTRLILEDKDWLVKTYGFEPEITTIVDSKGFVDDDNGLDLETALKTKTKFGTLQKFPRIGKRKTEDSEIISGSEAETLVETTPSNFGDGEPGLGNIRTALVGGKHVVTTNKGPLAMAMSALVELASHRKKQLRFSGTVGGGTPFLDFGSKCLRGDRLLGVHGILNGTTNYILSRMEKASLSFKDALREAQEQGFAEKDPTNDIEGLDTAVKIVILSNWILKRKMGMEDVKTTGISKVTSQALKSATKSGSRIKLVGRLSQTEASVGLEEVDAGDPTCVSGTLNALTFSMEHAGDLTLIGEGAGGQRTASSIIRDLVDIRREYLA